MPRPVEVARFVAFNALKGAAANSRFGRKKPCVQQCLPAGPAECGSPPILLPVERCLACEAGVNRAACYNQCIDSLRSYVKAESRDVER